VLACFQDDPAFSDLLLELPQETSVRLSILNLWNTCDEIRHHSSKTIWDFICRLQTLENLDLHFTGLCSSLFHSLFEALGDPFGELPKAEHPEFSPFVFRVSNSDLEALIGIVLNESEDLELVQTTIKRIQRAAMTHLESLEDSKSFQQFILKLLHLLLKPQLSRLVRLSTSIQCLELWFPIRSCRVEDTIVILQTLYWLVKNSSTGLDLLQKQCLK